ncbi:WD repeat domain-containing protein 83-like [Babylonia areolata]|uniref:WD repeat domain-containing protein 83-like n=1 Tax=Babylonia areolata TaxID=304850 RepID=UPI003FD286AB
MKFKVPENKEAVLDCKQQAVRAVRFSVDSRYCMTCGSDKSVKLWNPHRALFLKTYVGHGHEVLDAQGSGDNSQICTGAMDKTVVLFDVASGQAVRKYRDHAGTVNCVKFNEESTVILSGSLDNTVRAWDTRSRSHTPIQVLDEATDSVTSLQVSDHEILTGSADGKVRRYDLRVGRLFADFIGKAVTSVTFTRDGQCSLVSSQDNAIRLMDKDTGEMLNEFTGHKHSQYKIDSCLNNEDTLVVSGSEDGKVYFWDLVEAKLVHTLDHSTTRPVHSLAFHHSEACLLTACADKVFLWRSSQDDDS